MKYVHQFQYLGPTSAFVAGAFISENQAATGAHTTSTHTNTMTPRQSEIIFEEEASEIERGALLGIYDTRQASVLLAWASERHRARLKAIEAGKGLL